MENEPLRVGVLADRGTVVFELLYKPRDLDFAWLASSGVRDARAFMPGSAEPFLDTYPGGRQDDVILLDTAFWGGIRPCIRAAHVCETFQLGVAVHSSGELGIQLSTMLHLGAVIPLRGLGGYPYDRDPGRPGWFRSCPIGISPIPPSRSHLYSTTGNAESAAIRP